MHDIHPLAEVGSYYARRLATFGANAAGVDWKDSHSQTVRFQQLERLFDQEHAFSLNDLGSGYGALWDYLAPKYASLDYLGIDLVPEMVEAGRARSHGVEGCRHIVSDRPDRVADFTVASGIFNVRLACDVSSWKSLILETLDRMHESSRRGFAFNSLTSYSDAEKMQSYLHYADPCELFGHCKRRYARNVALLHDYDLYEFTLLIRKTV